MLNVKWREKESLTSPFKHETVQTILNLSFFQFHLKKVRNVRTESLDVCEADWSRFKAATQIYVMTVK